MLSYAVMVPSLVLAAESEEEEVEELELVEVTGTRIQVPGATSSNPIESVTAEDMRRLGIVNVADALLQLIPQNQSTWTDFAIQDNRRAGEYVAPAFSFNGATPEDYADRSQYFIGNTIANLRGLDPAFGTRTLTMVDGRRIVSTSSQADVVDLNIIPSNLLSRMDVVTGGASATYGSGAVAGVVNLVLNNRLTGFNLDMDYGIYEAGDGQSPHIAASGGMPLFGGRGHFLVGAEWQKTNAILSCARARSWCAQARTLFTNGSPNASNTDAVLSGQFLGYENFPARFQLNNMRYSQFDSNGVVLITGEPNTLTGWEFTDDGTSAREYALGYRGGTQTTQTVNGDGPPITDGQAMRSENDRKTIYTRMEFNFTERTTGYMDVNYAKTEGTNRNNYTTTTDCVKFNSPGADGTPGITIVQGARYNYNNPFPSTTVQAQLNNPSFRAYLGITNPATFTAGFGPFTLEAPYHSGGSGPGGVTGPLNPNLPGPRGPGPSGNWPTNNSAVPPYPSDIPGTDGDRYRFDGKATGQWELVSYGDNNKWWRLVSITITAPGESGGQAPGAGDEVFYDPGVPDTLPEATGRNAYAFLRQLDSTALEALQRGYDNSPTTGQGGFATYLMGSEPCNQFTAVKKVWNPQFQRYSSNTSETKRIVLGVRGRFGRDWRWDASGSYGKTNTKSTQNNAATNLRRAWAMDAVIDDREDSDTFGEPICRVLRDGVPVLDVNGRESGPETLELLYELAAGCQPLNIFGSVFTDPVAAARQQAAIDYAFIENTTLGSTELQNLSVTTNGTFWEGWGAGPMTGAIGVEYRKDTVDNSGSQGNYYDRFDIQSGWSDKFGGSTAQTETFLEVNMPLVSGVPGVNLWSFNGAVRYNKIKNAGTGDGTVDASSTRNTTNWRISTTFEPFDWIRLRLTRSRDLRAPTYRDLFIQQSTPGGPNVTEGANPWRPRTIASSENQQERFGTISQGNPELEPEISRTLTMGLVISPSGWAQGLRFTADYYNIKVRNGFATSYANANPIQACWEGSGNQLFNLQDPTVEYIYDRFNPDLVACQRIIFAQQRDAAGNEIPGTRDLNDIVWYLGAKPENAGLPYQRRGIDLGLSYTFPLSRAFASLPGNVSLNVRANRALEASGFENVFCSIGTTVSDGRGNNIPCEVRDDELNANATFGQALVYRNLIGQIGSSGYIPGVSPTQKWTGNFQASYLVGDLTTTISARYTGGALIDRRYCDPVQFAAGICTNYTNAAGQFLSGSIDQNTTKPYFVFSLNGSYNLRVADMRQFQIFGSVNNLFNKDPPWAGGYTGAYDTVGRAYRMGVRLRF